MSAVRHFPTPSDRMGFLWTLTSIDECYVVEFGPAGTTHFAIEGVMELNAEHKMNVYTTHITDVDITFGRHDKLAGAVREIDGQHSPGYIFVMASSVTSLIGVDIESICLELQDGVNAKLIPVPYGGYDGDYSLGVERALLLLAEKLMGDREANGGLYNIIGCNIDSYNFLSDRTEIESCMSGCFGMKLNSCLTAYTSVGEIERAPAAGLNLIIRAEGIKAAEYMKKRWGTPYVYGKPYGPSGTLEWIYNAAEALARPADMDYITRHTDEIKHYMGQYKMMMRAVSCRDAILCGEYDTVAGMSLLLEEFGLSVKYKFVKHAATASVSADGFVFSAGERQLSDAVRAGYYIAFGDDNLRLICGGKNFCRIANPNMESYNFYSLTPFAGFNGAKYLLQWLMNFERAREKSTG